ncbi:hypothetical protein ACQ4PT_049473 [Festuca glaucescens]
MDPAISFLLTVRMDTYQVALDGSTRRCSEFDYPLIVESSMNFNEVQRAMCNKYPWGMNDTVVVRYLDRDTNCYVDVKRDDDLALMFGKHQDTKSVVIQLSAYFKTLLRTVVDPNTVNAHYLILRYIQKMRMYPDIVPSNHDYIPAIYASTDDEEDQEDIDMGGFKDGEIEEDADRPIVEYDKNDPSMDEGTVFGSVIDCRNALATFAIVREFDYITEKSDPTRLRAHCAFEGCRWRIHASFMKNSKLFQIKVNPCEHTCPTALESEKLLAAKSRWVCDVVLEWVRENPTIGVSKLIEKIHEKYRIKVPYVRVSNGREKAMDKLVGKWADSFHLLYTFKAEVEKCSPGSVVDIDRHTVQYKVRGVTKEKECFRRFFLSFKACSQGFKDGCRPYLAVDATALNGRFRGQLVAACAIDAHNWLFPVAYGVLEAESTESWTWWLYKCKQKIMVIKEESVFDNIVIMSSIQQRVETTALVWITPELVREVPTRSPSSLPWATGGNPSRHLPRPPPPAPPSPRRRRRASLGKARALAAAGTPLPLARRTWRGPTGPVRAARLTRGAAARLPRQRRGGFVVWRRPRAGGGSCSRAATKSGGGRRGPGDFSGGQRRRRRWGWRRRRWDDGDGAGMTATALAAGGARRPEMAPWRRGLAGSGLGLSGPIWVWWAPAVLPSCAWVRSGTSSLSVLLGSERMVLLL